MNPNGDPSQGASSAQHQQIEHRHNSQGTPKAPAQARWQSTYLGLSNTNDKHGMSIEAPGQLPGAQNNSQTLQLLCAGT